MPEVAEAAVMAEFLDTALKGMRFVEVSGPKAPDIPKYEDSPVLETVTSTGKKVVFVFDNEYVLVASLGMTGRFLFEEGKYTKFTLTFMDEEGNETALYYDDVRGIGSKAEFLPEEEFVARINDSYGPDPLRDDVDIKEWMVALSYPKSRAKVHNILKDQSKIHGVGNYLRSEILYRARISPYRELSSLTEEEFRTLIDTMISVVKEAYEAGGFSMRDYIRPDGSKGKFVPMIYGRKGKTDEGHNIQYDKGTGGQSIYWSPDVQI